MNPFLRYLADKNSAHTQTDTHTDRQTDTRRWPQDLAAYGAQVTMFFSAWSISLHSDHERSKCSPLALTRAVRLRRRCWTAWSALPSLPQWTVVQGAPQSPPPPPKNLLLITHQQVWLNFVIFCRSIELNVSINVLCLPSYIRLQLLMINLL